MRHHSLLAFFICASALIASCNRQPVDTNNQDEQDNLIYDDWIEGVPEPIEQSIIPGECLKSPVLSYDDQTFSDYYTVGGLNDMGYLDPEITPMDIDFNSRVLRFFLKMDLDVAKESLSTYNGHCTRYRFLPSDDVYDSFLSYAPAVRTEYNNVYNSIDFADWSNFSRVTTILYRKNTLSIIADAPFAGIAANDELKTKVFVGNNYFTDQLNIPGIDREPDTIALNHTIMLYIPVEDYNISISHVTFTLSMPVKVGMYLHWLEDRLTDPDAQMQYRDEALTCKFTIHKGLN